MLPIISDSIWIDNIPLSSMPHTFIRSHIIAVPQEPYILPDNVRINIDPSGSVSDDDIRRVLEKIRLWEVVEQRGGLDVSVDDETFSQGQKQLLMLARAMVRRGRFVLLDEITSNLDEETADVLDEVMRDWWKDCAVVAIAHKLKSIRDFDSVAVLDQGRLVEFGQPHMLLQNEESVFRELWMRSTGSTGV